MSIKKLVRNEYIVGVVCNILNIMVGVVYSAMIVRYLGKELKGQTAYISSVMTIASVFLSFGLHQVYPYYRKDDPNVKDMYMNNIYLIFAVYSAIAAVICWQFRSNEVLVSIIILSVIAAYMRIVSYVFVVENSVKQNVLMLVIHIVQLGYVGFLILFTTESLFWGVTNLIFVDLVLSVVYTVKIGSRVNLKKINLKFIGKSYAFGFVPMITILASKMSYKIDVLMLEGLDIDVGLIGIYSVGVMFAEKVLLVPDAMKNIMMSKLAKGKSADEVAMVMRMCFPVCFLTFLGIVVAGQPLIDFMYGKEFNNAYAVTVITMFGVCAIMFHRMIELYNIVNHKQKFTLMVVVTSTVINVLINLYTIPRWGIEGAAVATVISYGYSAVVSIVYFTKHTGIKIRNTILLNKNDIKMLKGLIFKNKKEQ